MLTAASGVYPQRRIPIAKSDAAGNIHHSESDCEDPQSNTADSESAMLSRTPEGMTSDHRCQDRQDHARRDRQCMHQGLICHGVPGIPVTGMLPRREQLAAHGESCREDGHEEGDDSRRPARLRRSRRDRVHPHRLEAGRSGRSRRSCRRWASVRPSRISTTPTKRAQCAAASCSSSSRKGVRARYWPSTTSRPSARC